MRSVDLDITTPAGWSAYQRFLATGRLPDHAAKGASNETRSEISTWLSKDELTAKLSGAGVEGELSLTTSDNGGQVQVTHEPDGSTTYTVLNRVGGVTRTQTATTGPGGKVTGTDSAVHLEGVDEATVTKYLGLASQDTDGVSGDTDVSLTFTKDQLDEIRQQALEGIAGYQNEIGSAEHLFGEEATADNVAAYLEEHPDGVAPGPLGSVASEIAAADDPNEIYAALVNSEGNPDAFLQKLIELNLAAADYRDHDHDEMADDFADTATTSVRPTGC